MDPILFLKRSALFFALVGIVLWLNGFRAYEHLSVLEEHPPVRLVYAAGNPGTGAFDGYAWSDLAGWISFKGTNYGVTLDANGNLDGYAWSDTLGWLSFERSTAGSPAALEPRISTTPTCSAVQCNAFIDYAPATAEFVGFGRFLSACVGNNCAGGTLKPEGGGWDGWVSLSRPSGTPDYQVLLQADNTLSGYAWGHQNVGWVNFNDAGSLNQVALTPDQQSIVPPSAAPATGTGAATAKLVFYTDRAELSSVGTFVITPNGAAAQTFPLQSIRLRQGGSDVTGVSFSAYNGAGDTVIPPATFTSSGNQSVRFRVGPTCGTCSAVLPTGNYIGELTMTYQDLVPPTTKTFVANVPIQITNLTASSTQER